MSERTDAAAHHFKTNRVSYSVSTLIPLFALLGAGYGFSGVMGEVVDQRLQLHNTVDHAVVGEVVDALLRIERRQLSAYIRDIMIWQCVNTSDRTRDRELSNAQDEYFELTSTRMPQIDCNRVR